MDDLTPVRLRDGTDAVVVPLLPANREALREGYAHLSPETQFHRFLAAVPELNEAMLVHLVDEVDEVDHVALVLLALPPDGTEVPMGVARMIRYPEYPTAADVAVTVADEWQGRGVATALLEVLVRNRPVGVEQIVTVVSADNPASISMLQRLGEAKVTPAGSGTLDVVVDLAPRDGRQPSPPEAR